MISKEEIERFLLGTDPQKYIVAIEAGYDTNKVDVIVNNPDNGKTIETHKFKPFVWFKEELKVIMYNGKRLAISKACERHGVKLKLLRTSNDEGFSPPRMENGYKFIAICDKNYNELINFFKEGGVEIFKDKENKEERPDYSRLFLKFSPNEQFMIQSGKRLFKGIEDYDNLHRFQFDLETEGLFATKHAIFQIGIRDNRGLEGVLETTGDDGQARRNSERYNIDRFFQIIDAVKPDVITGYNSEDFDWNFLFERAERLSIPITEVAITLNRASKIKRKSSTVKFGGETQPYTQTNMYGYNIIDVSHAVRRAMAINSDIKAWGLKYITKYSDIAKPNRVYVPGDKINTTWADKENKYSFNDVNGDWYKITDEKPLKDGYKIVTGAYIVQRYLCDDLWETEQIDNIFNQASFLIAKMLPTTFQRSSTMGTACQWKLIMAAWSYENKLAIPETQDKKDFTGGLSRLLCLGYSKNAVKFDFAALYPKTQLTHLIFPDLDITGVMEGLLTYVVKTRDESKFLTGKEKKLAEKLEKELKKNESTMSSEDIVKMKEDIAKHWSLSNLYDKKQLPLKTLANSWFGSYGATHIFNWGDLDSAEETTCRGRQYLRLMVKFFTEKYNFKSLVLDTDGCNFSFPDDINNIKYVAKGSHWKTKEDAGKELSGLDAVLAEFNENYMTGWMGLDNDGIYTSTINFSRKNYANDTGKKIKLVGNSIKSKKMSVYIEEFLAKGIRLLLDGDGYSFIKAYYEYVDKIYNYQIPLVKIASKAKVKSTIKKYKEKAFEKNKAGNPMPKQAHMELAINAELNVDLGDVIYYINTGKVKSHGDLKSEKNKETGITTIKLNCKLIESSVVERDFELIKELDVLVKALTTLTDSDTEAREKMENRIEELNDSLFTDEYNSARYLAAFNKKIKPLLVCFHPDVRNKILLDVVKVKDKTTKKSVEKLKDRIIFSKGECELVSGMPNKPEDQDSYEELMTMEDKEIKFWLRVNKIPNNLEEAKWEIIKADYFERMKIVKINGINEEKEKIISVINKLELKDFVRIRTNFIMPSEIIIIAELDKNNDFISRKWGESLCNFDDILKSEKEAIKRDEFYKLKSIENIDGRYEQWLEYVKENESLIASATTTCVNINVIDNTLIEKLTKNNTIVEIVEPVKKKITSEEEDDEEEDDENIETTREDEIIKLDDEVDDTIDNNPEYVVEIKQLEIKKEEPKDEWGF